LEEFKKTQNYPWLAKRGLDLAAETAEISVYAHAINGGVLIDEKAASTVPGLFAAGEVAGGAHGADRLGGGMFPNCQIFGARAGRYAAEYAANMQTPVLRSEDMDRLQLHYGNVEDVDTEEAPQDLKKHIQSLMFDSLLIERNGAKLSAALAYVNTLEERRKRTVGVLVPNWDEFEFSSLLEVGKLMLSAAFLRQESRGSHYRSDYPEKDDRIWGHCIALRQENGEMKQRFITFEEDIETGSRGTGLSS
jgi:succinate dehydrogenase/fumarate reductase flavoprotein subunit